jgi:hypothetical protein
MRIEVSEVFDAKGAASVVTTRAGLSNRELFDLYAEALKVKSYFGYNWDALDECLGSLEGIKSRLFYVRHEVNPVLKDSASERIYFEILVDAADSWNSKTQEHEIVLSVPSAFELPNSLRLEP